MVFEDMQWADASLLDFIDYLLEWSRSSPLFVFTLARPELHERRPAWGAASRNFTSLYLEPLPATAMDELLTGLVPGLPDELADKSSSVPRASRCTRSRPCGCCSTGARSCRTAPSTARRRRSTALEVPETLHALIAARLDGLGAEERRLLQDAAVLGKTFTTRRWQRCSAWPRRSSSRCSARSSARRCSASRPIPAPPSTASTASSRTWSATSPTRRSPRTAASGTSRRPSTSRPRFDDEEVVEVLASHYLDAYEPAPDADDATEIRAAGGEMLARAGERAASLARRAEGAALLRAGRRARGRCRGVCGSPGPGGPDGMAAREERGARALFDQARTTLRGAGRFSRLRRVSALLAEIDFREGHPAEAVARLEKALATLAGDEPGEDLATIAGELGRFLSSTGRSRKRLRISNGRSSLPRRSTWPRCSQQALTSKAML